MESIRAERQIARRKLLLEGRLAKVIPLMAVPMVISMLITSLYNLADTFFVSQLGTAATAAVGVNNSLMHAIMSIAMGFGAGAGSYISRLLGAKDNETASRTASTAVFTAMGVCAALGIIGLIFKGSLVMLLGATESSKPYSMDYATYILIAAPITAGVACLGHTLRSEGSTIYSMLGMVSGCVINCILDPIFITTLRLEVAGAAIATAISKAISLIVLLIPYIRHKSIVRLDIRLFTPKKLIYREIARMGIPTMLRSGLMTVSSIITNNFAGDFGDSILAAMSVANRCMMFLGSMILGFGQGFQPVAGYCWGAKLYRRVKKAFWFTSAVGLAGSIVLGTLMYIFAGNVIRLFSKADMDVINTGIFIIRAQSVVLPLHTWVMVVNMLFQAMGHASKAAVLSLSRQGICLIPSVICLSLLFGVTGLSVAQAFADVLSMLIAVPMIIITFRQMNQLINAEQSINNGEQPEDIAINVNLVEAD